MDSVLRPRDIQARIRSGESPETVAEAARTTVDKIMGFATPVLAERAYVAEQALKASVRRRAGDGPIGHLGEAVEERLAGRGVTPEQVSWDAWRREDGRWTLVADFPTSGIATRAQFVYDQAGRYVTAEDDDARWLVGERSGTQPATTEHVTVTDETVVETVFEPETGVRPEPVGEQLPLGDDAIEVVTGVRPAPEQQPADDWMLTQASERTSAPPSSPAETLFDVPAPDEPSPRGEDVVETGQAEDTSATDQPAKPPKPSKSSKSRRASVPSWDEIMFGSGKGE